MNVIFKYLNKLFGASQDAPEAPHPFGILVKLLKEQFEISNIRRAYVVSCRMDFDRHVLEEVTNAVREGRFADVVGEEEVDQTADFVWTCVAEDTEGLQHAVIIVEPYEFFMSPGITELIRNIYVPRGVLEKSPKSYVWHTDGSSGQTS